MALYGTGTGSGSSLLVAYSTIVLYSYTDTVYALQYFVFIRYNPASSMHRSLGFEDEAEAEAAELITGDKRDSAAGLSHLFNIGTLS